MTQAITCDDCGKCCAGQAYIPLAGNMLDNDFRREEGLPVVVLPAVLLDEDEQPPGHVRVVSQRQDGNRRRRFSAAVEVNK